MTSLTVRTLLLLLTSLAFLAATGVSTAQEAAEATTPPDRQLTLDDLRTFTDVFNLARRNYVEPVEDRDLLDAAIRGMLADLDPHSAYLSPEEFQDLDDASRGQYSGIGISVQAVDLKIEVMAVINGSPADEAGIDPGDIITVIDGAAVRGRYLPDAIDELDGEPGTGVDLTVVSPQGEKRELHLTREYIDIPTLSYEELDDGWGYFKMTQFHRDSAVDLQQALESIAAEGTVLRGLVIDLRDNPGGLLQPAVNLADGFLEDGLIVTTRGRNASMQIEFRAQPGEWMPGIPLALLVDRGSASASEVLAGALQDHGRALVVGERTFGKGSVQSVLPLRNGGGIKLTTARYYTPSGRSIQAEGIVPDIVIEPADGSGYDIRVREVDLEGHLDQVEQDEVTESHGVSGDFPVEEMLEVLSAAELIDTQQAEEEVPEEENSPD